MNKNLALTSGVLGLFVAILLLSAAKAQSSTSSASFDVINYTAQIEPDLTSKSVMGKVKIQFKSLANNLAGIQINAGVLEIDAVRDGENALKFEKKDDLLNINLLNPAKLNERREIEIEYHGVPKYGLKFYPEQKQIYTVFSTSQWMPCVDAPDDRASFSLNLILPKDFKVVGNGQLTKQSIVANDKISYLWEQKTPVPTYIFGFAAGDFREIVQTHRGVNFRYLAAPQFSDAEINQIFRDTADMFDFYEKLAGVKYPDTTYTQVLATGGAQQEMSSFSALNVDYGRGLLTNERENWLAAHEMAHQWWGNMVTNLNWNHFWLNEGMATFMVAAYKEHRFGREEYLNEIGKMRTRYERVRDAGKDKSLMFPDWNKPTSEDRSIVYNKGGYVLHLLREEMGDEAFWKGIRAYTRKYWGKSVTTADFEREMKKASKKDLSLFFKKWVYLSV